MFKKIFTFPGPKDLGMSNSNNAMPSRFFQNYKGEATWEDYYEKLKELYPIKFLLLKTIPDFITYKIYYRIANPIGRFWEFISCNTIPSRMYHFVDIRQEKSKIDPIDDYRYGWIDPCQSIVFANFSILNKFIKDGAFYCPSEEDINNCEFDDEKTTLILQRDRYNEMMEVYNYWNTERKILAKEDGIALDMWSRYRKEDPQSKETRDAWDHLKSTQKKFDDKEEEMLIRLIKMRKNLWN